MKWSKSYSKLAQIHRLEARGWNESKSCLAAVTGVWTVVQSEAGCAAF